MNYLKLKYLFILLPIFLLISCSDDDGPTDFRLSIEGDYGIEDITLTIYEDGIDTTFDNFEIDPEITVEIDNDLDSDEMAIEVEEFLEDYFEELIVRLGDQASASIEFEDEDDLIIEIESNGEFELDDLEFDIELTPPGNPTVTWQAEMNMEGEIQGDEMSFDYEIELTIGGGSMATLEGSGEAVKE